MITKQYKTGNLTQIAMPMGGIGAGCICLNGYGGLQDFSIRNHPSTTAQPDGHQERDAAFALVHFKGEQPLTRLVEGPLPYEIVYDQGLQAQGYRHGGYEGLPRFRECRFTAGYPFGVVYLTDPALPLEVEITGWSPLIPLDDVSSGMPCAVMEYTFRNTSERRVDFEFSYHTTHTVGGSSGRWAESRNVRMGLGPGGEPGGGVHFETGLSNTLETFGSGALYAVGWTPRIKAMWLRGGWFDGVSALWREVSTGTFTENDGTQPVDEPNSRNGGSIMTEASLEPGESITYPVVIAWHFPNSNLTRDRGPATTAGDAGACGPAWRPFYAGVWNNAAAVARHLADNYESLRGRTAAFQKALLTSTVPPSVLDAVSSNLAILKSPTVLRQENGNVWAWEGCFTSAGCCHGSCTHVWNYAQALPHLFPALERTLREQELQRSMDDQGHINFRAALPDGPPSHGHHAAADGQLGGIMKLCRDWKISGDLSWLERLYPQARRSLEFCIKTWDPDRKGGLFEPHHNTYDIEFWGPDGMCGSIYVGALSAMAEMARALNRNEDASVYGALAKTAAEFMANTLFNGDYFQQNVQWEGLRDLSFMMKVTNDAGACSDLMQLVRREGPRYQYGSGCISDGVIGAWMAGIYGIDTDLDGEKVRATLASIFKHNFKTDLSQHACTQRPGYAVGNEPGLLLCTWPRGGKPTLPFVYSDEVWTGIEYQVASHLIEEGFVTEGLTIVQAVRSRYDGRVRNPFNEYECGSYYARALASYAVLNSLSGFRYSAPDRTLRFGPKIDADPYQTFFSTNFGYGTIRLSGNDLVVSLIEGELPVDTLLLTRRGVSQTVACNVVVRAGSEVAIAL